MALKENILQKGIELYNKVKSGDLTLKYGEYRNDGMLDLDSSIMDCSMFILKITKEASSSLFSSLTDPYPNGKYGGNTSTIKAGILAIEGLTDISKLRQINPQKGDWLIWTGHIEIVSEVTATGGYVLLGASGAVGGTVPKLTPCRNLTSAISFAQNFKGIWSPKENSFLEENGIKF